MISLYHTFLGHIIAWQKEINFAITEAFETLEATQSGAMYGYIIFSAFVYGLVHALGPGHGKMIIASYFLVHGANIRIALKAAFLSSIIHTLSALSITTILYLFFQHTITKHFQLINENMYKLSACFIIFIALFLLYETLKARTASQYQTPSRSHDKTIFKLALSIGIVPCPGVMSIVLFSMILGYYTLGVASAVSMSLGMGITMSLAAILSTQLKQSKMIHRYESIFQNLSYVGIALLFGVGVAILV